MIIFCGEGKCVISDMSPHNQILRLIAYAWRIMKCKIYVKYVMWVVPLL